MCATYLRQFVIARWHAQLRISYLLTGDLHAARSRLARAMAGAAPEIRGCGRREEDAERAVLVRLARDTMRTDLDHVKYREEAVPLWDALATLPALSRVALVLDAYADLPPDDVAALLREKADRVAGAHAAGLNQLHDALRDAGAEADAVREQLADVLRERAADVPLDPAPYEQITPVLAARRRRRVLAGVAALLVLVLLVAGYSASMSRTPAQPAASGTVLDWPARGPLASDAGFLDGIHHRAPGAHVLYAGDVDNTRVVLVARVYRRGDPSLVAFEGPAGTMPQQLSTAIEYVPGLSTDSRVIAWADPQAPWSSPFVVLAASDARSVAVSSRPRIVAGRMQRSYRTHRMKNGVYAGSVSASTPRMMRVSVSGPGGTRYDGPVAGIERHPFFPGARLPVPRQKYGPPIDQQAWTGAVAELAETYRVRYADLDVLWRWTRQDGPHTDWVVAMYRLPSGAAVLQVRWWSRDLGEGVAVNSFVRGRPVADPRAPVAWRAGYRVDVLYPGHEGCTVRLHGASAHGSPTARTDATGYASLMASSGVTDFPLTISTKRDKQVWLEAYSPFDDDPLDVSSTADRVDHGAGNP